jgi:two-component sensor histidine kinase
LRARQRSGKHRPVSDRQARPDPYSSRAQGGDSPSYLPGPKRFGLVQIPIGTVAGLLAVAVRFSMPLSPVQLPTLTVVVATALTSTFIGLTAGITTALVGGLLSWYLFFTPFTWDLTWEGAVPLLGFFVIAAVIIATSHLYRLSEQRHHRAQIETMRRQAESADLFAREMAHRLKNALAIVQSIAFQTLGGETAQTGKFSARLKALADTHDLLSEHVEKPTADVADVVQVALRPFADGDQRLRVDSAPISIAGQQAVSLALALHELGTNASKYGAWSGPNGRVSVRIEEAGDRIRLTWQEQDGPPVQPPTSSGFGTKLLERVGSEAQFRFDPNGLSCSFALRKG